jgi:hypothetical protein
MSPSGSEPTRKRKRLTHACTQCRTRKVRCDEARPRCTNCDKAGTQCITQDPRNPGIFVERREAQSSGQTSSPGEFTTLLSAVQLPNTETEQQHGIRPASAPQLDETISPERRASPNSELLPALPRHAPGYDNSLSMLSQWLDLAFIRLGIPQPFRTESSRAARSVPTAHRAVYTAEVQRDISSSEICVQRQNFMEGLNAVFPIFTQESMARLMLELGESGGFSVTNHDMASILFALIVAANVQTSKASLAKACLDMALGNLQVIVENRTIHSVRALLLIGLIYRCRDDVVLASNMISLAASNAQALGLHRQLSKRQRRDLPSQIHQEQSLVWSCVYILEKLISMELGRLSTIRDFECNQTVYPTKISLPSQALNELFLALLALAKLQSEMSERLALSRHMEESTDDIDSAIRFKMEMVGELDQKLLEWTRSLPPYAQ